ncbi:MULTISPECIES: cobalamin-binding protein [unclassified Dehalobacter]|uniref:ABC transporter substrate-binding protein n=1 Tax=unclassified Dehalobacter TaxID=2635733 RepID=UPI000E6D1C28|nr:MULTISPECIES: cobalamin-binding protein [unclassified Dehalobacter]MCM1566521.1 cobalamin-binding protein [Dehalobacter sp.]RJE47722.1 cobalamin-binding protein [Dehalobacter sp. MCB1]TCX53782.1 cobalamin-binding protein [Dehalobacter sp. 14DCB1]TCX55085.1 cobalamin-binding protein [Dehalobacter sp. 12DCB1]
MKKKPFVLLLILTMVLTLALGLATGCSTKNQQAQQEKMFTDTLGREITIDKYPQKIISLAPAITEILFAIGLDQEIIGVSEYCDYPEQALTKEKMGGFKDPNVEMIVAADPDMVFISAGVQEDVITKLEELGTTVVVLDADTIDQVISNIELAGSLTGKEAEATALNANMRTRVENITSKVKGLAKPSVFVEIWDDPLMSAGSTSFVNNIIEVAGGVNIAADNTERYYNYSMENLLQADPDYYIINTHAHTPADIQNRAGYKVLSAVKNNRVFAIDDNLISRAGPRVIEGLEQMAVTIHPEVFGK